MIGTQNQINFAKNCMSAANAQWSRVVPYGMGATEVDRDGSQRKTAQWLMLVDAGNITSAEAMVAEICPWGMSCITYSDDGKPAVDAGAVITALKRYL